ncbi:MAG: response regulator transcription factor [Sediminibacterium sp.]|nr:response regulator transcription factor [Sediminibacterium sp.]
MILFALAEDDVRYRLLIKEELKLYKKNQIIIDANDGLELLLGLNKVKKMPDCILLDIQMPKIDGLLLAQYISHKYPELKMIGISTHSNIEIVTEVLSEGAIAFISKYFTHKESAIYQSCFGERNIFFEAIESATNNNQYIDLLLINKPKEMKLSRSTAAIRQNDYPELTENQIEFIILNAADLSFDEIADIMQLSRSSIKSFYNQLAKLFDIHSRAELVTFCIKRGLIKLPSYYDKNIS